jgi:hypothetical protein
MQQPELSADAAEGKGKDLFAAARAQHPDARLVLFHDRRTGERFTMAVPPSSPWHALLPPQQEVGLTDPDERARRE